MTAASFPTLPIAAFCDLEGGIWGIVVGGPDAVLASAVIGDHTEPQLAPATLERSGPGDLWTGTVSGTGTGHTLTIAPALAQAATPAVQSTLELCHIRGVVPLGGSERTLDCAGIRCSVHPRRGTSTLEKFDSLRLVAAWFPSDVALALLAIRPSGAKGQERDEVAVVLHDERTPVNVFDPRLSTTYRGDGTPSRMGIELWLGATQDGDLLSLRAAGEVTAPRAALSLAGVRIAAYALRCQSIGEDGAGVYIFARPEPT
ncbi:MAG: hypothetical protein ACLP8S_25610 [Solirubrobacteraceae bacterium]